MGDSNMSLNSWVNRARIGADSEQICEENKDLVRSLNSECEGGDRIRRKTLRPQ